MTRKVSNDHSADVQHQEMELFKRMLARVTCNYSEDESIIPGRRDAAADSFIKSAWVAEVVSDVENWPRVPTLLKAQLRERAKGAALLLVFILISDSLCAALAPSEWASVKTVVWYAQAHLLLIFSWPRVPDFFLLRRWERVWRDSARNSSRDVAFEQAADTVGGPKKAQYLLWLVMPRSQRRDAISDLNDQFETVRDEHGLRHAQVFYWWEVARSCKDAFGPFVIKLVKMKIVGAVINWLRHQIEL